jgi:chemotaxis signal transduction protein
MSGTSPRSMGRAAQMRHAFDCGFAAAAVIDRPATEDLLAIRVAGKGYALRLSEIAGLFADRRITPVPGRTVALLGIAGFRGNIIPVYDLSLLLGHPRAEAPRWLVTALSGPFSLAFEVFECHLRTSPGAILPRDGNDAARYWVPAFIDAQDQVRGVVHLPSILNAISNNAHEAMSTEER